jgi:hypothetical protein
MDIGTRPDDATLEDYEEVTQLCYDASFIAEVAVMIMIMTTFTAVFIFIHTSNMIARTLNLLWWCWWWWWW